MEEFLEEYKKIYQIFRRVQSTALNRGYKMPANWEQFWHNKLTKEQRETLRKCYRLSITTWQDIDLYTYFECGFELWKGFSYHQWFNVPVINLYIQKAKIHKKVEVDIKKDLIESAKFVKQFCKDNNIETLKEYANLSYGSKLVCIEHFLKDKISKWFLCFLIYKKIVKLSKENWTRAPEINDNYAALIRELREIKIFIDKLEALLL